MKAGNGCVAGTGNLGGDEAQVGDGFNRGRGGDLEVSGGAGSVVGSRDEEVHGDDSGCGLAQDEVGKGPVVGSLNGSVSMSSEGVAEGTVVDDIILDTGCSRTMIHQDLVPEDKKISGEAIMLRCAHGDTVLYPFG